MRAAVIEARLGNTELTLQHVRTASERIVGLQKLTESDRCYLLDFCDVLAAEVSHGSSPQLRLRAEHYTTVSARVRRQYPLEWH
jgi:hypothetical protein